MNILVCNDDGINSEGIIVLAKSLSKEHNVLVVAPKDNRSAFAHSITIMQDMTMEEVRLDDAFKSYAISGTPADCVKFAKLVFPDFKIDLVCSGINRGHNLGSDIIYSGTVSAGFEANYLFIPAIAFSSTAFEGNKFDTCGVIALKIIDKLRNYLSSDYTYNVNVPNLDEKDLKGIKFTKLGIQLYTDRYEKTGENEYRLVGEPMAHDLNDDDCDVEWNKKGYVTVTPLIYDKTHYLMLKKLNEEF